MRTPPPEASHEKSRSIERLFKILMETAGIEPASAVA
jgi:hypothetical protein